MMQTVSSISTAAMADRDSEVVRSNLAVGTNNTKNGGNKHQTKRKSYSNSSKNYTRNDARKETGIDTSFEDSESDSLYGSASKKSNDKPEDVDNDENDTRTDPPIHFTMGMLKKLVKSGSTESSRHKSTVKRGDNTYYTTDTDADSTDGSSNSELNHEYNGAVDAVESDTNTDVEADRNSDSESDDDADNDEKSGSNINSYKIIYGTYTSCFDKEDLKREKQTVCESWEHLATYLASNNRPAFYVTSYYDAHKQRLQSLGRELIYQKVEISRLKYIPMDKALFPLLIHIVQSYIKKEENFIEEPETDDGTKYRSWLVRQAVRIENSVLAKHHEKKLPPSNRTAEMAAILSPPLEIDEALSPIYRYVSALFEKLHRLAGIVRKKELVSSGWGVDLGIFISDEEQHDEDRLYTEDVFYSSLLHQLLNHDAERIESIQKKSQRQGPYTPLLWKLIVLLVSRRLKKPLKWVKNYLSGKVEFDEYRPKWVNDGELAWLLETSLEIANPLLKQKQKAVLTAKRKADLEVLQNKVDETIHTTEDMKQLVNFDHMYLVQPQAAAFFQAIATVVDTINPSRRPVKKRRIMLTDAREKEFHAFKAQMLCQASPSSEITGRAMIKAYSTWRKKHWPDDQTKEMDTQKLSHYMKEIPGVSKDVRSNVTYYTGVSFVFQNDDGDFSC